MSVKINSKSIPKGMYCYDKNGTCPFFELRNDKPRQMNGYCHYMKLGDWEVDPPKDLPENFPLPAISLLWDMVKECGINLDEDDD